MCSDVKALHKQIAQLESAVISKDRTIDELREQLQLSDNKLRLREDSVRILEERIHLLQDKLKAAENSLSSLTHHSSSNSPATESTASPTSANAVSYLTAEVHRLRRLLANRDNAAGSDADDRLSSSSSAVGKPMVPVPPSKAAVRVPGSSSVNLRRTGGRKGSEGAITSAQFHSSLTNSAGKPRLPAGRKVSLAESDSSLEELPASIPDPTPFLSVTKAPTVLKREHLVLPPILHADALGIAAPLPPITRSIDTSTTAPDDRNQQQYVRRPPPVRSKVEVEMLAVDQVKSQKDHKTSQEFKGLNLK